MSSVKKIFESIQKNRRNVKFGDITRVAEAFGFEFDRLGSNKHHIYKYPGMRENLNLQEVDGEAKPYQIGQLLRLIEEYGLVLPD